MRQELVDISVSNAFNCKKSTIQETLVNNKSYNIQPTIPISSAIVATSTIQACTVLLNKNVHYIFCF